MNMLQKIETLTQAEEAILAASAALDDQNPDRASAANALRKHGLPNRRVEAWHYTDLRARLKGFSGLAGKLDQADISENLEGYQRVIPAIRIPVLNGQFLIDKADEFPEGVTVRSSKGSGFRDATDAIALLQTLLGNDGAVIDIAKGIHVDTAIGLAHRIVGEGATANRHKITVGEGAKASFIERHLGEDGVSTQSSTVTDLQIDDGAEALWVILQETGDAATHLAQLNVTMGASAKLTVLVLNSGGALVRQEINVVFNGEDSGLAIRGVNLVGEEAHIDVTTSLVHEAPNTVSSEIFRNVATGEGTGVFQGEIRVAQLAQKTDARMACNTLLLTDTAEFFAKPELEIFADDVQCAHGATVTDIDDNHLFYMRARGIPEREARSILVKAFVEEVFDELEHEELRDALNMRIEHWLDRHG